MSFIFLYSKDEWEKTCDGDEQCLFDSAAMGSLEIGQRTKDAHRYYRLMHESIKAGRAINLATLFSNKSI
jgi:hypothetical protein